MSNNLKCTLFQKEVNKTRTTPFPSLVFRVVILNVPNNYRKFFVCMIAVKTKASRQTCFGRYVCHQQCGKKNVPSVVEIVKGL